MHKGTCTICRKDGVWVNDMWRVKGHRQIREQACAECFDNYGPLRRRQRAGKPDPHSVGKSMARDDSRPPGTKC